jgi:pimeloyl-ACP methyl ester carboxylesterase
MDPAGPRHLFPRVNGITMHAAAAGSGPLIVLLHGFPQNHHCWSRVIPLLAPDFTVLAPDTRGVGLTEITAAGYDLDTLAADIANLIGQAGTSALVVGHDWGGVIAWHLAASYPGLVRGLVAVSGPHPGRYLELLHRSPRQLLMAAYAFLFQLPWLPELFMSAGEGWVLEQVLTRTAASPGVFSREDLDLYRREWARRPALTAGLNYYRALGRHPLATRRFYRERLIRCPVRVAWGADDFFLSLEQTAGLERFLAAPPRVTVFEGCGHWVPEEKPDELARIVRDFASGLAPVPAG